MTQWLYLYTRIANILQNIKLLVANCKYVLINAGHSNNTTQATHSNCGTFKVDTCKTTPYQL